MQANVLTFISHQTTIGVTFPCSYTAINVMDVQGGFYGPSYSRGRIICWFTKMGTGYPAPSAPGKAGTVSDSC